MNSQLGVKTESVYGTAVVVDRFYEFETMVMKPELERLEGNAMRSTGRVQRKDRSVHSVLGYAGTVELNPMTKGFGWWLTHMLGALSTGSASDSVYPHTGTIGALNGKSFTMQGNSPLNVAAQTSQPFTYEGCKVNGWTIECEKNGLLKVSLDIVAEDGRTATALASASYPTGMEYLSWAGGAITVDSGDVPVTMFKLTCANNLKTDRHYLQSSARRAEPTENGRRELTFEFTADFSSLDQYNRVTTEVATDAFEAITATWTGPTLVGTSSYPSLAITLPAARFDEIDGYGPQNTEQLMQTITGKVTDNGSDEPLTIVYTSADSTA